MKGWRGKTLITIGLFKFSSSTHVVVTVKLTHTVVPYAHTVVVCVVKGGPLKNMGLLKLFFSSFLRRIDPHSGSVYPYRSCLCYGRVEGKPLITMGLLKLFSSIHIIITRGQEN